jgi:hypothetical protein
MKTGKTLDELAVELDRRAGAKKDYVVSTENIEIYGGAVNEPLGLGLAFGDVAVGVNDIAHSQIAEHAKIPQAYYNRCRAEAPQLLASNIRTWFRKYPARRLVRTLDGACRAFPSDKYRPLENEDLFEAVYPTLKELGVIILSAEITERRLYIKAVDRGITRDIPVGKRLGEDHARFDTLSPAIVIQNSEVGLGPVSVSRSIYTHGCTNLSIAEKSLKKLHLGGRHELGNEEVYAMLSDQSRSLSDAALWSSVRDVVKASFEAAQFEVLVEKKVLGMTAQPITGNPVEVINLSAKRFGLNDTEKGSVLRHLIEGADLSRYGLFNAVTRTAEDLADYDRATDFERLGGEVIELSDADWRVLAEAA